MKKPKRVRRPKNFCLTVAELHLEYPEQIWIRKKLSIGFSGKAMGDGKKLHEWLTKAIAYLEQEKTKSF